jgi:hypothetical protein
MKITLTNDDGSTVDFLSPADVQAAVDAVTASEAPVVAPEATEIDLVLTDGTTKKFVPAG